WLQSYLKFGPERPRWAYVVDALISRNISKSGPKVPEETRVNVLLQTWNANLYLQTSLPREISEMFKVGKKYGLNLQVPQPTTTLQSQLPIWYPIGQDPNKRRTYTSKECECLRTRHHLVTAGDARLLAQILENPGHKPRKNCKCNECWITRREVQCTNPHKCAAEAERLLDNL
ncbi:hypothetical protein HDZ31DRAFT_8383, partial [Schizophyllum fasciatum]